MPIIQFLLRIHTIDLFLLLPFLIGFLQRVHHKRISQQIHVSFSREVIHLPLNFSCGLLLIGPLIYSHAISQEAHNLRQTDGYPRHVFLTAAYISSVIRPCTCSFTKTLRFKGS